MFNFIGKFFVDMKQKKIRKIKDKQAKEFKEAMNEVYRTIKWIEKQMPNRKSRRQFYSDICHRGFIHSKYSDMFLGMFLNRDEVVLTREEYNKLKANQK